MFRATQDTVHLISTCIRGYHPLWPNFPDGSTDFESDYVRPTTPTMPKQCWFGLIPVRSPLLRESLIVFFSSGYLDVSVLRVASINLCIQFTVTHKSWVFPFGNFRIKVFIQLPETYRSITRPSSTFSAKASIKCS